MLAIAMTLVAGAAAWGFVRSQAGNSESALNANAVATNNMLDEHFSVTDMYFGSTTSLTFLVYNTGSITDQVASVRVYDSGATMNLFYNYTKHSPCSGDCALDLKSSSSGKCKTVASTYESPSLTQTTYHATNEEFFTLTIPSPASGCPSFSATYVSTDTYTIVVTGVYGNVQTFSSLG